MISLGGMELNPNLTWSERYNSFGVTQSTKTTLGGRLVISTATLYGGRLITLVASGDQGWLTKAMADHLLSLTAPGEVLDFTFHDTIINAKVMLRHHEAPALELQPLINKWVLEDGDFFIGTIKLIQV